MMLHLPVYVHRPQFSADDDQSVMERVCTPAYLRSIGVEWSQHCADPHELFHSRAIPFVELVVAYNVTFAYRHRLHARGRVYMANWCVGVWRTTVYYAGWTRRQVEYVRTLVGSVLWMNE